MISLRECGVSMLKLLKWKWCNLMNVVTPCKSINSELERFKFDGVFSNNVLEHLRYPVNTLQRLAKYLSLGGRMALATPCFEYLYEYTRFHLFFYLGRSRELLVKKAHLNLDNYVRDDEFMCLVLSQEG